MNTAQPVRNEEDLNRFKEYYRVTCPNNGCQASPAALMLNKRNYLLVVMGLNTALRISDILKLQWDDVYDFGQQRYKEHLSVTEQKTDKNSLIFMNHNVREALVEYRQTMAEQGRAIKAGDFLFENSREKEHPITRIQAFRIIKKAAKACQIDGVISCHSLRKTFGYHAWQQGIKPALLMNIYNHSSFQVTVRYLGIEQDDRDNIFRDIDL